MKKNTKIILLALAALFFFIGIKSYQHSKPYAELTNVQAINGTIYQLHCPPKGAASLSLTGSKNIYNLSTKFRTDYCDDDESQVLLGKEIKMQAVQVNGEFYQVYEIEENAQVILTPEDVANDQSGSTVGLFLLAFLLAALVAYKSYVAAKK